MRKVVSCLLAVFMLLGLVAPMSLAANETNGTAAIDYSKFTDVKGHWAEPYMKWAVNNQLMYGVSTTKMSPNANITRAQMATMIARAFGATQTADISMFIDVDKNAWYYPTMAAAYQMGILETFGNSMKPNEAVTREEVAVSLVKAAGYPLTSTGILDKFMDKDKISYSYRDYFATAVSSTILNGYGDGRCGPQDKITRAQFATMLHNLAEAYMTQITTYGGKTVEGSLLVGVPNIKLSGMTIARNLFLTDGIGNKEIVLDGTSVTGMVIVRGASTVYLSNNTKVGSVIFSNPNGASKLVCDRSSTCGSVTVMDGKDSVALEGRTGDLNVNTGKCSVNATKATLGAVNINATQATVLIDSTTTATSLSLRSGANGAEVKADGRVGSVTLDAPDADATLNGTITSLTFGANSRGTKFTLGKDVSLKNVEIKSDRLDLALGGKLTTVNVDSEYSEFDFNGDYEGTMLSIEGREEDYYFKSGSKVKNIEVDGDDIDLVGNIDVTDKITILGGEDIYIHIPNVKVYNKGGAKVYVGDVLVKKGSTVTANASGTGTREDDKANGRDPDDTTGAPSDSGSGSSGSSGNSGNNTGTKYTITFDANGGSCRTSSVKTDSSGGVPLLPDPTRSGYKFLGWFTSKNGGNMIVQGTVVTKSQTVYAHWERNSGGGSGGDSTDPEKPGNVINPTMSLSLLVNAQPSDIDISSGWTYSDFGQGLTYDASTHKLTGTVKKIDNFTPAKGRADGDAGYYVPFLITTDCVTETGRLMFNDAEYYGSECNSSGTAYSGKVRGFATLDPTAATKTIVIVWDPDGTGTKYNPVTDYIDYSDVVFEGLSIDNSVYGSVTVMPGADGAETPSLRIVKDEEASPAVYNYVLSTTALVESRNSNGRYGYWVGLKIPAPDDCTGLQVLQKNPDSTTSGTGYMLWVTNGEDGSKYIEWVVDASAYTVNGKHGSYELELLWYKSDGVVSEHPRQKVIVNLDGVVLAGEGTTTTPNPVVTNLKIELANAADCSANFGIALDDLGLNLRISQNSLGGYIFPNTYQSKNSYWVPVKISGVARVDDIRISRDSGAVVANSVTKAGEDGSFYVYAMLELEPDGRGGVKDTRITCSTANTAFTSVEQVMRCDNAIISNASLVPVEEVPSASVDGHTVASMITDPVYTAGSQYLMIAGTAKKQASVEYYGNTYEAIWTVPLTFRVRSTATAYSLTCNFPVPPTEEGGEVTSQSFFTVDNSDVDGNGYITLAVPVAIVDGYVDPLVKLTWQEGEQEKSSTVRVAFSGEFEGLTNPGPYIPKLPDPGPGTGTDPTPTKELKSIEADLTNWEHQKLSVGEALNLSGIVVKATYTTDSGEVVEELASDAWTSTPAAGDVLWPEGSSAEELAVTTKDVIIKVKSDDTKTAKITVSLVKDEPQYSPKISSISLTGPTKTTYSSGETLDLDGLVITANLVYYDAEGNKAPEGYDGDATKELQLTNCSYGITYAGAVAEAEIANGDALGTAGTHTVSVTVDATTLSDLAIEGDDPISATFQITVN